MADRGDIPHSLKARRILPLPQTVLQPRGHQGSPLHERTEHGRAHPGRRLLWRRIPWGQPEAQDARGENLSGLKTAFRVTTFFNYAIADGLYNLLFADKTGVNKVLKAKKTEFQLSFGFWGRNAVRKTGETLEHFPLDMKRGLCKHR